MKRFVNPNKKSYYSEVLSSFSDESKPMFVGIAKSFVSKKYKWIAEFLFKHRTNEATNPHKAYVSFFSDQEMVRQEYAQVAALTEQYPFLTSYSKQQLSPDSYELSSPQYAKIGQKFTDFDLIEYIDAEDKVYPGTEAGATVNHTYKDLPVFHAEGYQRQSGSTYKYVWANPGTNPVTHYLSRFGIALPANQTDLTENQKDVISHSGEKIVDYKVQVDHKNYFYFDSAAEWVVYHSKTDSFNGNDKKPFYGSVVCYDDAGREMTPKSVQYFPDILVDGKVEMAKTIIQWPYSDVNAMFIGEGTNRLYHYESTFITDGWKVGDSFKVVGSSLNDGEYTIQSMSAYWFITTTNLVSESLTAVKLIKVGGRCAFSPGNIIGSPDDQSKLVFNVCEYMFEGQEIKRTVDTNVVLYNGIDLDTERNKRSYATIMTEPYFTTKAINNGSVVNYKFINSQGLTGTFQDYAPCIYLKIKASLDMIRSIDQTLSLNEFNNDIIDTIIISDHWDLLSPGETSYYKALQTYGANDRIRRQGDGVLDLIKQGSDDPAHIQFVINAFGPNESKYSSLMKVAGLGFYADINRSGVESQNLAIYCHNYSFPESEDFLFAPGITIDNSAISQYEKFKPMLKMNGINGYVKILKKNKYFPQVQTSDGQYEVVYNVEFPYCPGSYSSRRLFGADYKTTQILYKDSYIPAGSCEVSIKDTVDNSNERQIISRNQIFGCYDLAGSKDDVTTAREIDGGGTIGDRVLKTTVTYPGNRVLTKVLPDVLSAETDNDNALNCQIKLLTEPAFSDYKLMILTDNRRWRYDTDKYEPYVNRENPSYVFEMDVGALFNDYYKNQKDHDFIPDVKRWLNAYSKSFASMSDINGPVGSDSSKSDIVLDIWDQAVANWRIFSPTQTDDDKIITEDNLIVDNLCALDGGTSILDTGFYTFNIGYSPIGSSFPTGFDLTIFDSINNVALYDQEHSRIYHVAFIDRPVDQQTLAVSIKWDPAVDPALNTTGSLSIFYPTTFMGDTKDFEVVSKKAIKAGATLARCQTNKYIDIRKVCVGSDLSRYVNADSKVFFRIRVARQRDAALTKISVDEDGLQYVTRVEEGNNPWNPQGTWDAVFDAKKAGYLESVNKLALTYFKLSSI